MDGRIELELVSIVPAHSHGAYTLVLNEKDGRRNLSVLIGAYEAQAIAMELEGIKPSRPLTHDLFLSTLDAFHIVIVEVTITDLQEGIFFSKIICAKDKDIIEIDSRTSDAIALAAKFHCPIFCSIKVLEEAGYEQEDDFTEAFETPGRMVHEELIPISKSHTGLENFTNVELEKMLEEAIRDEDYTKAAKVRDEISKRK